MVTYRDKGDANSASSPGWGVKSERHASYVGGGYWAGFRSDRAGLLSETTDCAAKFRETISSVNYQSTAQKDHQLTHYCLLVTGQLMILILGAGNARSNHRERSASFSPMSSELKNASCSRNAGILSGAKEGQDRRILLSEASARSRLHIESGETRFNPKVSDLLCMYIHTCICTYVISYVITRVTKRHSRGFHLQPRIN